ncbi:alpha-1,6-mannosylglycoprotein 6-beta-N-acetylglucosaminyltransferase A-like [Rhopilema esculentum]|uniref:alpha-1,6-mannosylglycoprotein 6-beta-N-acetylglucosaminyltransferase A-like n=1 Tax=Rhopilema esculentum TaxID=499914 RepID=UPI0031DED083
MQRLIGRTCILVLIITVVFLNVIHWIKLSEIDQGNDSVSRTLSPEYMRILKKISSFRVQPHLSKHDLIKIAMDYESPMKKDVQTRVQHITSEIPRAKALTQQTSTSSTIQQPKKEHCLPFNDRLHPLCQEKFQEIKKSLATKCYKEVHKLDGSNCSILSYLQEIEPFCGKSQTKKENLPSNGDDSKRNIRTDLQGFLTLLKHKDFHWMRKRATALWSDWVDAAQRLDSDGRYKSYRRKRILIYPGALSIQRWLLERAGSGTFLGELVQWTDTIASAYVLGHDITVVLENKNTRKFLKPNDNGCASKNTTGFPAFDLIFTDILGENDLRIQQLGPAAFTRYRCKVRVLDSFGTDAEFNYKEYHKDVLGGRGPWGNLNLLLPQFFTYFPHSPDNTFLGFASGSGKLENKTIKKDQAVIYGKITSYLQDKLWYIDIIKEFFEVHATMAGNANIPSHVKNHGVLSYTDLMKLLKESKVFVGLGFPYEGPAPLEAIASGAVFLNPKFTVPKNKINEPFFGGKPNARKITSQNQYMEDFVNEPHSHTLNISNKNELRSVLKKIKEYKSFTPYLPMEFTNKGMLERLAALIEHQDLCNLDAPRWPPLQSLYTFLAEPGVSCKDECHRRGLICEWSFFHDINNKATFKRFGVKCNELRSIRSLESPSFHRANGTCFIQEHYMYFSCVAYDTTLQRLCPCRTFIPEQSALCQGCL